MLSSSMRKLLLLALALALLALPAVLAVYEDQHQEYDWQISNIGPGVDHVIFKSKYVLTSTSEGVLASINLKSGKTLWRSVFGQNTRVIEMVASDEVVYTLSQRSDPRTQTSASLVQAWATDSGDLLWDFAPPAGGVAVGTTDGGARSALLLDEKLQQLRVLDNTQSDQSSPSSSLLVLDAGKGTVLVQLVSTDLVDFLPTEQQHEEDAQLVFLQLLEGGQDSSHVLSGCLSLPSEDVASSSSASAVGCQFTFVVDLNLSGLKRDGRAPAPVPRVHVFPGFPAVTHYSQVQTRIAPSSSSSFGPDDIIAATSFSGGDVIVSAILLASQRRVVGMHYFSKPLVLVTPVLLTQAAPSPLLALSVCSSSSSSVQGTACAAHVVDVQGDYDEMVLRELVTCEGSSGTVLTFERVSTSSNLAAAAVCVSLSSDSSVTAPDAVTCPSSGTEVEGYHPMILAAHCVAYAESASSPLAASFQYSPTLEVSPAAPSSSMTLLRDAFVFRYKVMATGEERLKVLVLSSSGALHLFQKRGSGELDSLQWTREEALARVVDSVILEGVSSDPVGHKRVESLEGKMPTFKNRLRMQFVDLQDMFLGWAAQLRLSEMENILKKVGEKSSAMDRPTMEAFGFNQVSVMFTSVCAVETASFSPGPNVVDTALDANQQQLGEQCLEGFKVYGLDLITGEVLWTFEPVVTPFLPTAATAPYRLFGRLLKVRPHVHGAAGPEITLLLSVESVANGHSTLLTYSFNPHSGMMTGPTHRHGEVCESAMTSSQRLPNVAHNGLGQVASIQLYNGDTRGLEEGNSFLLVHEASEGTAAPQVTLFPHTTASAVKNSKQREVYTQVCTSGSLERGQPPCASLVSYRVNFEEPLNSAGSHAPSLYPTEVIGSVVFNKLESSDCGGQVVGESVVAVKYPTAGDPVHSRAKVLGDNSLLIKYMNPHLAVVVTEKLHRQGLQSAAVGQAAELTTGRAEEEGQGGISLAGDEATSAPSSPSSTSESSSGGQQSVEDETQVDELFVNVIDTVSAQIVHRYSILHASTRVSGRGSVQVSWIENNLLVSYWSTQAQRQELSSVSLFEGMIDKYGLSPFSSIKVDQVRSSFNAPAPIALQKTFILPRKVTSMHHTVTSRGITNKNLLLGLGSGQLYTVDLRMLDPRRPVNKPTPAETEEKLMQYVPFIPLHPFQMLSTNSTLPPVQRILSSPSKLESTSIVVALGLDVYHTRTVPSKGFDMLASDFNKPLLSLILASMGAAVAWLRRAYKRQLLSSGWK